jgi:hypothetical protein
MYRKVPAMPIFIRNPKLEATLDKIAQGQPARTTKHGLVEAMLVRAVALCVDDPMGWMKVGSANGSADAQSKSSGHLESDDNQTTSQGSHRANGNAKRQKSSRARLDVKG